MSCNWYTYGAVISAAGFCYFLLMALLVTFDLAVIPYLRVDKSSLATLYACAVVYGLLFVCIHCLRRRAENQKEEANAEPDYKNYAKLDEENSTYFKNNTELRGTHETN